MNSVLLNDYFKLGLDSESEGIEAPALVNTFRTAPVNQNSLHNKVTFKIPKQGLLTKDSGVVIQAELTSTANVAATVSNNVNVVNGILGSIKRSTLLIDSKPLIDLENPSFLENNRMYSRNNPARLLDIHRNLLGSGFKTACDDNVLSRDQTTLASKRGQEALDARLATVVEDDAGNEVFTPTREKLSTTTNQNKRYFIPLSMLGCNFLRYNSLPVYLMKDRDIELVLEFDSDCTNWAFNSSTTVGIVNDACKISLDTAELCSTHVLLDEETEKEQRQMLQQEQASYSLIESYLVKGVFSTDAKNVQSNDLYRINLQNRECHKLTWCMRDLDGVTDGNNPLANQIALSLGDESYNYRVNGSLVFDEDVANDSVIFYLNSLHNNGSGLKVSKTAWSHTGLDELQNKNQTTGAGKVYDGCFHYQGLDLQKGNGSGMVFGEGTTMRTPLELIYQVTPVSDASPDQTSKNHDTFFYVSASKLLKISPDNVVISF